LWAGKLKQPKHLVLTQKNFTVLTKREIRNHTRNLAKFRRSKCFSEVRGGSVSVEITNEERGWHLHSHWLLNARWLDMEAVSRTWGGLVGQSFAVVKIKDVRGQDYVKEISKYVVEGSELAKWPAEHVLEFVTAIKGRRFFFTFGELRGFASQVREELEFLKPEKKSCECGRSDFTFETETQSIINEASKLGKRAARAAVSSSRPESSYVSGKKDRVAAHSQAELLPHRSPFAGDSKGHGGRPRLV
jgi:hypothetical protein